MASSTSRVAGEVPGIVLNRGQEGFEEPALSESLDPSVGRRVDLSEESHKHLGGALDEDLGDHVRTGRQAADENPHALGRLESGLGIPSPRLNERAGGESQVKPHLSENVRRRGIEAGGDVDVPRDLAAAERDGHDRAECGVVARKIRRHGVARRIDARPGILELPVDVLANGRRNGLVRIAVLGVRVVAAIVLGRQVDAEARRQSLQLESRRARRSLGKSQPECLVRGNDRWRFPSPPPTSILPTAMTRRPP